MQKSFYRTTAKGALQSKPVSQMSRKERHAVRHTLERSRDMRMYPDSFATWPADSKFTRKKLKETPGIGPRPATYREQHGWKEDAVRELKRRHSGPRPPTPQEGTAAYAASLGVGKGKGTRIVYHRGRLRAADKNAADRGVPRDQAGNRPSDRTVIHERNHARQQRRKGMTRMLDVMNDPKKAARNEAGANTGLPFGPQMGSGYDISVYNQALKPGSNRRAAGHVKTFDQEELMNTRRKILDKTQPGWQEGWRRAKSGKIALPERLGGDMPTRPKLNQDLNENKGVKGKVYRKVHGWRDRRVQRKTDKMFAADYRPFDSAQ